MIKQLNYASATTLNKGGATAGSTNEDSMRNSEMTRNDKLLGSTLLHMTVDRHKNREYIND